jgi:hypothetical protein
MCWTTDFPEFCFCQAEPQMWGTSESSHELGILALVAEPHESVVMSIANDICIKVWDTPTAKTKKTRKNQNRCKKNSHKYSHKYTL